MRNLKQLKMKKVYLLFMVMVSIVISSCDLIDDNSDVTISSSSSVSVGTESPLLSILEYSENVVECSMSSSWLRQNFVSIEASVTIDGVENSQDYYTRSTEVTSSEWGLQITDVDIGTGKFYIYLEAPKSSLYRNLPAILSVVVTDADGGQTIAMRSIKFEEEPEVEVDGIPQDSEAGETPVIAENTVTIPDFTGVAERDDASGYYVVNINITGISDGDGGYIPLKGTGDPEQNLWLEFDNVVKGICVTQVTSTTRVMNDIVFLVDNSGSMSDEADGIATSIQAWATELYESGIDAQFGCVGYNDYGKISGAIDLTDVSTISTYLDRTTGTSRTVGFDATDLSSAASLSDYTTASGECGVVALRFADDLFSFRSGSNRIYVNFTDEPNQTNGYAHNSVEYVNDSYWSGRGTVHTVYSSTSCSTSSSYNEDPRLLSTYTGGTSMTVSSNFSGVTLSSLPVSGAIQNAYIVQFTNIEHYIGTESSYSMNIVLRYGDIQSSKITYIEL